MKRSLVLIASLALSSSAFSAEGPDKSAASSATVASASTSATASGLTGMQGSSTAPAVETTVGRAPLDSLYMTYFGTFHGGSVSEIGSAQTVNRFGDQQTKPSNFTNVNMDSEVGAGYRISKHLSAGVVVPFIYFPVYGQSMILGDVGVRVSDHQFANIGGAKVAANLIVQAPTSDSSKERGQTWALKTTPSVRYAVPRSNLTLGSWGELKAYFGVEKAREKTFKVWAGPYARYALSEKFALNLQYSMEWRHDVGQSGYMTLTNHQTDLEPGFVWNITPKVMLNPFLQIFTTGDVSLKHTAVGAVLSAAVL